MQSGGSASFLPVVAFVALIGWSIYRRTRTQRVRMTQTVFFTALIVIASLLGLSGNARLFGDPLFLVLAPVALIAGLALGWMMMRTIRFWRDGSTGQVWMSGGAAYVALWLVAMLLRLGVNYMATGGFSNVGQGYGYSNQPPTVLSDIASDMLFLSIGLWLARGYALVQRYRALTQDAEPH